MSGLLRQVESQLKEDVQEAEMNPKSALLCKDSSQRRFFGP